ncbi:hypothetical protein JCM16303_001094 [Sporobolomyces ruberrimus]
MGNKGVVGGDRDYEGWMVELDEGREWNDFTATPEPTPEDRPTQNHPREDSDPPEPPEQSPPPPPTPPRQTAPPPPRRSHRLAGANPSHFVPLQGAPERALRLEFPADDSPLPSALAYATHDSTIDADNDYLIAASLETTSDLTTEETRHAINSALSTSEVWTGNHDSPQYWEIKARPDLDKWPDAMSDELGAFAATGTWDEDLVKLPEGRRAISVKWVLLIKRDTEGRVIKYKARLVARGDQQIDGIDYDETHSSTVRLSSVRLVFALLAAHPHWRWSQFDISNAYLLGKLDCEIYIQQPLGFVDRSKPKHVRRLRKALYGLKQGGREWQKVLREALESLGFKRLEVDHGMYVRRRNGKVLVIPTHVDDGIVMGDDEVDKTLEELSEKLEGKLKKVETGLFLGMRIVRSEGGSVTLDQGHYVKSILERFFPKGLNPVVTPLDSSYSTLVAGTEEERFDCEYREVLGALMYLSTCTRPDLTHALSFMGRFSSCPSKQHWTALVHICRYLAGTPSLGLRYTTPSFPFSANLLSGWTDADHGANKDTRRSISGYVFGIGDDSSRTTAISWLSKRQKSVAISSTEAESMAMSEGSREVLYLRQLLRELGFPPTTPTRMRGDNSGALLLASHPTSHSRTKLIDVHYHFTRERVNNGTIELKWVPTDEMVADVFTKGLPRIKHVLFASSCQATPGCPTLTARRHLPDHEKTCREQATKIDEDSKALAYKTQFLDRALDRIKELEAELSILKSNPCESERTATRLNEERPSTTPNDQPAQTARAARAARRSVGHVTVPPTKRQKTDEADKQAQVSSTFTIGAAKPTTAKPVRGGGGAAGPR